MIKQSELNKLAAFYAKQRTELEKAEKAELSRIAKVIEADTKAAVQAKLANAGVKGAKVTVECYYDDYDLEFAWQDILDNVDITIVHNDGVYDSVSELLEEQKAAKEELKAQEEYERDLRIAQAVNADPEFKALNAEREKLMKKLQAKFKKELK